MYLLTKCFWGLALSMDGQRYAESSLATDTPVIFLTNTARKAWYSYSYMLIWLDSRLVFRIAFTGDIKKPYLSYGMTLK